MKEVVATYRMLGSADLNEKYFSVLMGTTSHLDYEVLEGRNLALHIEEAVCVKTHVLIFFKK